MTTDAYCIPSRIRVTLALALSSLLLAACGEDETGNAPFVATFESVACEMPLPQGQDAGNVSCGWLTVPENRQRPEGKTIQLAVVVLHATGANPAPDPFVFLEGGPGGWAIDADLPLFTADFAAPIQSRRDIVIFDQRGTGRSRPALNCPEQVAPRDAYAELLTTEQEANRDATAFLACRARLLAEGNDLAGYNSAATAQDIADLMSVLGYDRFNLYGLSYGTRVALTALRDLRNERIRSVVLDSTVPLQIAGIGNTPATVQRSFNVLIAGCNGQPACAQRYPHLEQDFFALVDRFNAEPLTLNPLDGEGEPFRVVVTGDRLIHLAGDAFRSGALVPFMPLFVDQTLKGNATLLTAALSPVAAPQVWSPGLAEAVLCNEEIPFITPEVIAAQNDGANPAIVRAFAADGRQEACVQWDAPVPAANENEPVHSDVPALLLAGEFDTGTPPHYAHLAAETLTHSYIFEFRGLGHVELLEQYSPSGAPSCAMQLIAQFIEDPSHAPDGSCVEAIPPPQFVF